MRDAFLLLFTIGALGCTATTSSASKNDDSPSAENGNGGAPDTQGVAPSSLAGSLERIGLDLNGVSLEVMPLLLLKGGVVCDCLDEDLESVTLEDVRARRPKAIGQWRLQGTVTEINWGTKWRKLAFNPSGIPLGDGWTSSTSYERTSTMGVAGTDSFVGASKQITFAADGTFKLAGAATTSSSASTSKSRGTYAVKGWMMTLTFEDGTEQRVSAVTGADKPEGVLWLAGAGYSQ
jgi:hypothetical protein